MRWQLPGGRTRRRGFGLIEMAVTGVLLAAMALLCARVAATVATQRQATARREAAARLAASLVEEIRALPWAEQTTEGVRLRTDAHRAEVATLVGPGASLSAVVDPAPAVAGTETRRIVVTVAAPSRGLGSPVRLASWTFAPAPAPRPTPEARP